MTAMNIVNDINNIIQSHGENIVNILAQRYHFDPQEAIQILYDSSVIIKQHTHNENPKVIENTDSSAQSSAQGSAQSSACVSVVSTPSTKQKFVLPWSGTANPDCCQGLKNNYGLFTQCSNPKHEQTQFCKQCVASIDKNGDQHPCGTVKERLAVPLYEYKDPKGKKVVHYTQYMKKFSITKQQVLDLAADLSITIDLSHFTPPTTRRGRPSKKTTIVLDSDDETDKRPIGRPKKLTAPEPSPEDVIHNILHHHKLSHHTSASLHDHLITQHQRIPTSPTSP